MLIDGAMYKVEHRVARIGLPDYIAGYRDADRFIAYCKACKRYGTYWACPPFDFDEEQYITSYETAYLVDTRIILSEDIVRNHRGWDKCTKASYEVIESVRRKLDNKLLALERSHDPGRAFFAGTCHICPAAECARINGKPCVEPARVRPALEAFGFDVGKTSSELLGIEMLWSRDGVQPEYFTLVSGLFTSKDIP